MPPPLAKALAIWFGFGLLRPAPGSWGSLAALPLAWAVWSLWGAVGVALAGLIVLALGISAAESYCRSSGNSDPSEVVIDEVAGQLLTLAVVPPDWLSYALGFLFFRVFDILKPGPVGWADRRVKGGLGVMLDDVIAGILAGVLLYTLGKGTGWWTTI